jgi:TRAP-type C4-dicarboxylate transport system permease small subunit
MWTSIEKWYLKINQFLAILSGISVVLITLLICWEVFMRAVLHSGQGWVTEFSENLLVFMVFLGAAWVLQKDGHVSVDILYFNLKANNKRVLDIVISVIGLSVCLVMMVRCIGFTIDNIQRGMLQIKTIAWPVGIMFSVMSFGFFLLCIEWIRKLVLKFIKPNNSLQHQDETGKKISEAF